MSLFFVIFPIFIIMLLMPFLVAGFFHKKDQKAPLFIRQNNAKDPRFFAKSFRAKLEEAMETYDGSGKIKLSKVDNFYTQPLTKTEYDGITFLENEYNDSESRVFNGEIYCKENAIFAKDTYARAIAGLKDIELSDECEIVRWVDAEKKLICNEKCLLGISASSAHVMKIANECEFFRLYAPVIYIGLYQSEDAFFPKFKSKEKGIKNLTRVHDEEEILQDIVCRSNLTIGNNSTIVGDIKAVGDIRIKSGTKVDGNVCADGTIVIEEDCFIGGDVFSQDSVCIGRNSQVGRFHQEKSVIARETIMFCEGFRLFGFASCERGGKTVDFDTYTKETSKLF